MPSIADGERPASLHDALESLERASRTPAKQRVFKVSSVVDVVCHHAFERGLDEEALRDVVHIAARKTNLDQTSVTTLIKNLYPALPVPSDVVVTVVAALGQGKGKPTPGTQNSLVKWLAIVHGVLEEPDVLSRLYSVLFGMLDMISIRTPLCHLLSLITRRKHVKPFRIQALLEFSRSLGNEPALQGLLRIYKDYYPDIILGSTSTSRNSFPPRPDPEWRARLLAIQERSAAASNATVEQHNGFKVLRKGYKRIKASLIPDVHTFHANESSVTLEGIDNVNDFVDKLDRIEPPGQLISFLTDPLLQKFVELKPSPSTDRRIELWLSTCLEEQYNAVKEGNVDHRYLSELLDGLLRHTQYTKTLLPIVQAFLKEYMLLWDGVHDVDSVLGLLSYIPIQPFEDAYATFLQPAEAALTASNTNAHDHLLPFYTNLLRQWMNQASPQPPVPALALSTPDQLTLSNLTTHISHLSTSLLLSLPAGQIPDPQTTSQILTIYDLLSTTSTPYHIPILLPPTPLTALLILTPSLATLSRITSIIASYKSAFNTHPSPIRNFYPTPLIDAFNVAIRDLYHLLWISRALSTSRDDAGNPKALGLYCAPALRDALNEYLGAVDREYAIQTAFNVSNNALLASLAAAAWREMEEEVIEREAFDRGTITWHKGPVSQRSLEVLRRNGGVGVEWEGYRVRVLKWLEERGLGGLKGFLWASSEALRKKYGD
ncbi:Mis6-domain-containing protein [Byssothecium circinans]|uniref:Mis6-domain-containing protein n=1 Tax=Byssothecium circinans TaxID=147558 RepID=A0A6A5U8E0_9PLEO|nr:Mis6-domain-containing protein [Byssothecium circinans]